MAQKRMFDREIINTDKFCDMPMSTKGLYFILGMEADDYGFVSPRRVMRTHGGAEDDLRLLIAKGLVILFDTGVIVITDWNKNNWLDSRRVSQTEYQYELNQIDRNKGKYLLKECNNGSIASLASAKPLLSEENIPEKPKSPNPAIINGLATAKPSLGENRIEEYRREEKEHFGVFDSAVKEKIKKTVKIDVVMSNYDFSEQLEKSIKEWIQYKNEKRQSYKPTGLRSLISSIANNVKTYGELPVIDLINTSMSNNWQGIIWDKLRRQEIKPKRKFEERYDEDGFAVIPIERPDDHEYTAWRNKRIELRKEQMANAGLQ